MEKQNYKNHVRYYIPHHFILYPVLLACTIASTVCIFKFPEDRLVWIAITMIFIMISLFSFMVRQHYALVNQNRIVRLEMRLRYYQLTQKRLEDIESKLSFKQIAALRFASDEELPALVEKTLDENLSPGKIKRSIVKWVPDEMRV